jgi:hypothetical protein
MLKKFLSYDNVIKFVVAVSLAFMAFGAKAADFGGNVGINSDNYWRGINMSDGVGYTATGLVNLDNGIWAGANVMSMDEASDLMTTFGIGYGFDLGGIDMDVVYIDRTFQGIDRDGWNEVGFIADFDLFNVSYFKGLDDADDYYEVETSALKFVTVAYGDWDNAGSFWKVSKGWDLFSGKVEVGYVDHDSNEDDFADKIQDFDNFYVGYSYRF